MTTEKRLFRAYGQGCARGTVLYTVIGAVVFGGFCCVSGVAFMLPFDEEINLLIWAGLVVLFMTVGIGATALGAIFIVRRRSQQLDELFQPFGLEGQRYLTVGRQFHGTYRGYPMHIYFYRGPTLQIYLDVPLRTRIGIGRKGALSGFAADLANKEHLSIQDPAFDDFVIYPDDHQWSTELFSDADVRSSTHNLLSENHPTEIRTLSITPNALLWQSRYNPMQNINPENVRDWLNNLYELARSAQSLPAPEVTSSESSLEHTSRTDRGRYTWPIVGITCGFFAVMTICVIAISGLVLWLAESGY